jgi:hypothetical protein
LRIEQGICRSGLVGYRIEQIMCRGGLAGWMIDQKICRRSLVGKRKEQKIYNKVWQARVYSRGSVGEVQHARGQSRLVGRVLQVGRYCRG